MNSQRSTRHRSEKTGLPNRKDLAMLKEMGFRKSLLSEQKMDLLYNKLRMRQLDQLKMMFFRMHFMESNLFPQEVRSGILHNDLNAYSQAIDVVLGGISAKKKVTRIRSRKKGE